MHPTQQAKRSGDALCDGALSIRSNTFVHQRYVPPAAIRNRRYNKFHPALSARGLRQSACSLQLKSDAARKTNTGPDLGNPFFKYGAARPASDCCAN